MARVNITRTFTETKVTYARFSILDGVPKQDKPETITLEGNITADKAMSKIPLNGAAGIVIINTELGETLYSMPIDDFKKHSKPVDDRK